MSTDQVNLDEHNLMKIINLYCGNSPEADSARAALRRLSKGARVAVGLADYIERSAR